MRELKNGMKKLFAAIFFLFMNLIPGKRVTLEECLQKTEILKFRKSVRNSCMDKKQYGSAVKKEEKCGKDSYILKRYVDNLDSKINSMLYLKKEYEQGVYEDTG